MLKSSNGAVPVYTLAGSNTSRPLPDWLQRKRKRSLKQDPEFAHRVELLQDYSFEEASVCTRVSEDGEWVMSTGTYKPQIHVHSLENLSLAYARHTNTENQTFILLSDDYKKSLHLQNDRSLEFHTAEKLHHVSRLPRYGRDLKYSRWNCDALIPAVGLNENGSGEVFRLNLEQGRFLKSYEVDVGGDDFTTIGAGTLQGGINAGAVNCAAIAETSHNLIAFGTSQGTVECFDPRSKNRICALSIPGAAPISQFDSESARDAITALEFHSSGLTMATGSASGIIQLYDLRNPRPYWRRDQGYGFEIKNLIFVNPPAENEGHKLVSADKRIIKIWDIGDASLERERGTGVSSKAPWTSVEPAVDINHVEYVPNSGMFLTANEGGPQHIFFIPQLGPAPRWCRFIDNIVEEMAEDQDPTRVAGQAYTNYRFLTLQDLKNLHLDHLVGKEEGMKVLRAYMHGYLVDQRLYEEARLIANPDLFEEQRAKSIQQKIQKERESRIRGNKAPKVKVNKALAERIAARDEKHEARKAKRKREKAAAEGEDVEELPDADEEVEREVATDNALLQDPRFAKLFQDEEFEIDESSRAFAAINPSTKPKKPSGLTAVEAEEMEDARNTSSEDESSEEEEDNRAKNRIASSSYRKSGQRPRDELRKEKRKQEPRMMVSSSANAGKVTKHRDRSFGSRAASIRDKPSTGSAVRRSGEVGEKEITFAPAQKKKPEKFAPESRGERRNMKDRRSASGNVFRKM